VSEWWLANRPAARTAFWDELEGTYDRLREQPRSAPVARDVDLAGVRRLTLPRTRYILYYRVSEDDSVVGVLALWHASRGAGPDL
jgi:plasmid stabilization system protein ParE